MADGLTVQPVFEATAEVRRASSRCCGSKLNLRGGNGAPEFWECAGCGQECDRVLSEPEEVTFRG